MEDPIRTTVALVAAVLLLLANGFFVATEFALVSVRRSRIQHHALEGDPRASGILNRLGHLDISIAATQAEIVDETAHDLVGRAFVFTDLEARHVMVPRTEVSAIPVDSTLEDVLDLLATTPFTRIPVYQGDADNIIGIIKSKRLLPVFLQKLSAHRKALSGNTEMAPEVPFDLREYLFEPILVPETLPATEVLTQMRATHGQIVAVIDEYGGTAGIVTLKDIVTQLVGRIRDEEDGPAEPALAPNGDLHLDGLIGLAELREEYGIDLTEEDVDVETLGGYVFYRLGRPGAVGDSVTSDAGYIFTVEELDGLRVARVGVHPTVQPESVAA